MHFPANIKSWSTEIESSKDSFQDWHSVILSVIQIYWHDGDGHVMIQNVRTQTTILEDGKRFNTTSTIVIRPRKKHHNKTFTCSASNIADRSRRLGASKSRDVKVC